MLREEGEGAVPLVLPATAQARRARTNFRSAHGGRGSCYICHAICRVFCRKSLFSERSARSQASQSSSAIDDKAQPANGLWILGPSRRLGQMREIATFSNEIAPSNLKALWIKQLREWLGGANYQAAKNLALTLVPETQ